MAYVLDVEPANYIQLDIFPAAVYPDTSESQTLGDQFRVIITDNHLYAIEEGLNAPQFRVKESLISFEGSNKAGYTVTTGSGVYFIQRAQNCGCGSRLRGLHPFAGVPFVSQLSKGK